MFQLGDRVKVNVPHMPNIHGACGKIMVVSFDNVVGEFFYTVDLDYSGMQLDFKVTQLISIQAQSIQAQANQTMHISIAKFNVGETVRLNAPNDPNFHGEIATVNQIHNIPGLPFSYDIRIHTTNLPVRADEDLLEKVTSKFKVNDQVRIDHKGSMAHGECGYILKVRHYTSGVHYIVQLAAPFGATTFNETDLADNSLNQFTSVGAIYGGTQNVSYKAPKPNEGPLDIQTGVVKDFMAPKPCTCTSRDLFNKGCQCGSFKK